MLTALRSKAGGWVAKAFIVLLAGSFAVWGIADVFSGRQTDVLAQVGTREISATEYGYALNRQVRAFGNQIGQSLTPDQARQFGIHRQVLGQMLRDAALEAQADELGLGVSGETVAQRIADNKQFQNASGVFNADQFRRLLQNNGLSEQAFVIAERQGLLRASIADSIEQGLTTPRAITGIAHKHRSEQRDASYFIITGDTAKIADPGDDELQKFYDTNKRLFAVPERRKIGVLQISPESLADRINVSEENLKEYYDKRMTDYGTPEKRTVQQITFPSEDDAKAALAKIKTGSKFEDIAKERGLSGTDLNLGEVTRKSLPDQLISDAAFKLALNEVSQPVKGKLATALLRVTAIVPGAQKTFDEVREEISKAVKLDRARDEVLAVHDQIEDGRAGGQTISEVARGLSLTIVETPDIDSRGNDENDIAFTGISSMADIVRAAFDSDVGVENDPLTTGGDGFTWYEVRDVKSATTKPLADVRSDAMDAWKARQLRTSVLERVQALKKRADGGESLAALAKEAGVQIKKQNGLQRNEASEEFGSPAVNALFAASEDGFAIAIEGDGKGARLMKSTPVFATPFDSNSDEAKAIRQTLKTSLTNDLYAQYLAALQNKLGVTINEALFNRAAGGQS